MERANDEGAKFEAITFDLATGAKIRIQIDEFWEQLSESDLRLGQKPNLYFAIRVYSDEETNPRRMLRYTEFRAGNDFEQSCLPRLTVWLADLTVSRHRFAYDRVEDFLEDLCARMDEFAAISDDAADYLYKAHGIAPAFEDPPHAEFPEDQFVLRRRTDDETSSAPFESDSDAEDKKTGLIESVEAEFRVRDDFHNEP
jgi:hypothetical protein